MQLFILPFYRHDENFLRDFSVLGFFFLRNKYIFIYEQGILLFYQIIWHKVYNQQISFEC